jgi:hypothetical protein
MQFLEQMAELSHQLSLLRAGHNLGAVLCRGFGVGMVDMRAMNDRRGGGKVTDLSRYSTGVVFCGGICFAIHVG